MVKKYKYKQIYCLWCNKKFQKNNGKHIYCSNKCKKLNWIKNNKKHNLKVRRNWQKKQLLSNPNFKLGKNLRKRIWKALKGINKSKHTIKLLGCSIKKFKKYLEKQFTSKMSWNNYGIYWEIDHIIPCCRFDLSKPKEQAKCFNYTNMRPLTGKENKSRRRK